MMKEISRQNKDLNKALGDDAEKAGKEAGRRAGDSFSDEMGKSVEEGGKKDGEKYAGAFQKSYRDGMKKVNREVDTIELKVDDKVAHARLASIKAEIKGLKDAKIGVDMDATEAFAKAKALSAAMTELEHSKIDIEARSNVIELRKGFDSFIKHVETTNPHLKIDADFKPAERKLGTFEALVKKRLREASSALGDGVGEEVLKIRAKIDTLSDVKIDTDLDTGAFFAKVAEIEAELNKLEHSDINMVAHADVTVAKESLRLLGHEANKIDRKRIGMSVHLRGFATVMAQLAALKAGTESAGGGASSGANAFRAFNPLILALTILIPAVVPLLGALGGALLALLPILAALGAGAGVAILGFTGIATAVKALGDVQKNSKKDSAAQAKTMQSSARSVEDAERSLSRARTSAAQSAKDSARAVADAQRSATRSIKSALQQRADAQRAASQAIASAIRQQADAARSAARANADATKAIQAFRVARKAAQQDLKDQSNNIAQNKLDQRSGVVDLFNATVANNNTQQDGSASNLQKEQSSINLAQAKLRLKELREQAKTLADEKKKTDKKGIDGTTRVIAAQEQLTNAIQAQQDAQRALGEADKRVNKARIDGARSVQRADEAVTRARADGARSVQRAIEAQGRSAVASAQSVGDAERGLARARADAATAAAKEASSSQRALDDAMSKLGPAGRKFARFIFGLKKGFYEVRDAVQEEMLPAVQDAIEQIIGTYGPSFIKFVRKMGRAVGESFTDLGDTLTGPEFKGFFKMMDKFGPGLFKGFTKTTLNWFRVFARLMTIAAPWAEKLNDAMLGVSENALKFMNSKKGTDTFTKFLKYAQKVGPEVWAFLKNLVGAFVALSVALAPLGGIILKVLDNFLKWIQNMDPKTLRFFLTVLLAMVIAFQVMVGVAALVLASSAAFGSVLGLIVGAVIVIIGVLVALYTTSETARKIIDIAIKAIVLIFKGWLWYMKTLWGALAVGFRFGWKLTTATFKAMKWAWDNILWPALKAIGKAFEFMWKIIKPILKFMWWSAKTTFGIIKWAWVNILWPVIDLIMTAIGKLLWRGVIKPILWAIGKLWAFTLKGMRDNWRTVLHPILNAMVTAFLWVKDRVAWVIDKIGDLWGKLKKKLTDPVNFVIKWVMNKGLIGAFNKVANFVGSTPMKLIPLIGASTSNQTAKNSSNTPGRGHSANPTNSGYRTGGVLPGHTPGRDVHQFYSPTGGSLGLSGGEAIMRPEWTDAVGKDQIDYWNGIARSKGASALRDVLAHGQRFAKGGVFWPTTGHITSTYRGHDGVDINGPGQDYGNPIFAYRSGKILYAGYGHGYGNAIFEQPNVGPRVVYGHGSVVYVHTGQSVKGGQMIGRVGSTGHSTGPHLHFGIPGGTYDQAFALLRGAILPKGAGAGGGFALPGFLTKALKSPLSWLTDKVSGPLQKLGDNPFAQMMGHFAKTIAGGLGEKIRDIAGGVFSGIGNIAGKGIDILKKGAGHIPGFSEGGIFDDDGGHDGPGDLGSGGAGGLADNGAMLYDDGGYLRPGLTTVVNLTKKPEPVFNHDQFKRLGKTGVEGGVNYNYSPTFNASDLTANDIAGDMLHGFRTLESRGKYRGKS